MRFLRPERDDNAAAEAEVSALLEPRDGHSDADVVASLQRLGATDVAVLAPGFVSARGALTLLERLQEIASVHIKARKSYRHI